MNINIFINYLKIIGIKQYIGVPDSTLADLCHVLNENAGKDITYAVAPNEGSATAIAIGDYLSTKKASCVFMQNSGMGNMINPLVSVANSAIYSVPILFIIGWRGDGSAHDEPQHIYQGEITLELLKTLDVDYCILDANTSEKTLKEYIMLALEYLNKGKQYALVIRPGTFFPSSYCLSYDNHFEISRFNAIDKIIKSTDDKTLIVSTTGKISREVMKSKNDLSNTFLCVGAMGHASAISWGIARNANTKKVYCLDGDGSSFMHMGNIAFIGNSSRSNIYHFILNNHAHESVGGLPTKMENIRLSEVATACKYKKIFHVEHMSELEVILNKLQYMEGPVMIEINVKNESSSDLPRPQNLNDLKNKFIKSIETT